MVRGQVVTVEKRKFEVPRKSLKLKTKACIHNRFDIEIRNGETGEIKYKLGDIKGYNIILNQLWTRVTQFNGWFAAISYGSGTGELSAARTDLFARIGTKSASNTVSDYTHLADEGWVSYRKNITIDAGELTGQTIREVGISYDTSANHLVTHSVLRDMNGNQVSITVGELDVITIYATVFAHIDPDGYLDGCLRISTSHGTPILGALCGVQYNGILYPFTNLLAYKGEVPHGGGLCSDYRGFIGYKVGLAAFDTGTRTGTIKWSYDAGASYRVGVSDMNPASGGWNGIAFGYRSGGNPLFGGMFLVFPNGVKPYSSITDESVGTGDGSTRDYTTDFGFILDDGSFVLKIDGTPLSTDHYSVDFNTPVTNEIGLFLRGVDSIMESSIWFKSASMSRNVNDYEIVENILYATYGITSLYTSNNITIQCSNDLDTWETLRTNVSGTLSISSEYQKYRYWKAIVNSTSISLISSITSSDISSTLIHIDEGYAPANGAAVTASYRTTSIPKDINHVVDIELEITLNEYTG
jgi:hypothetical protein